MKPTNELKHYIKWCSKAIESHTEESQAIEEYGEQVLERITKFINCLKNCGNCRHNHKSGWRGKCIVNDNGKKKYCYELNYPNWKKEK
jgi:hypothetical protein